VATHKLDLLEAARDTPDELGPYETRLREVSSISKRDGRLIGMAMDPIERRMDGRPHPRRIVGTNRSDWRLEEVRRVHTALKTTIPVEDMLAPAPSESDAVCTAMAGGSLIAYATGLGKDRSLSPMAGDSRRAPGFGTSATGAVSVYQAGEAPDERGLPCASGTEGSASSTDGRA
jgi:hypothetical protein